MTSGTYTPGDVVWFGSQLAVVESLEEIDYQPPEPEVGLRGGYRERYAVKTEQGDTEYCELEDISFAPGYQNIASSLLDGSWAELGSQKC